MEQFGCVSWNGSNSVSLRRGDESCFKVGGRREPQAMYQKLNYSHENNLYLMKKYNFIFTELNSSSLIQYVLKSA